MIITLQCLAFQNSVLVIRQLVKIQIYLSYYTAYCVTASHFQLYYKYLPMSYMKLYFYDYILLFVLWLTIIYFISPPIVVQFIFNFLYLFIRVFLIFNKLIFNLLCRNIVIQFLACIQFVFYLYVEVHEHFTCEFCLQHHAEKTFQKQRTPPFFPQLHKYSWIFSYKIFMASFFSF